MSVGFVHFVYHIDSIIMLIYFNIIYILYEFILHHQCQILTFPNSWPEGSDLVRSGTD